MIWLDVYVTALKILTCWCLWLPMEMFSVGGCGCKVEEEFVRIANWLFRIKI